MNTSKKYKIGDICEVTNRKECGTFRDSSGSKYVRITNEGHNGYGYEILDKNLKTLDTCSGCLFDHDMTLYKTNNKSIMNILDKFNNLFVQEPQKSFRKAGITDSSDVLTDEGQKIFLSWLLKLNATAFKSEVVDLLLADEKKED